MIGVKPRKAVVNCTAPVKDTSCYLAHVPTDVLNIIAAYCVKNPDEPFISQVKKEYENKKQHQNSNLLETRHGIITLNGYEFSLATKDNKQLNFSHRPSERYIVSNHTTISQDHSIILHARGFAYFYELTTFNVSADKIKEFYHMEYIGYPIALAVSPKNSYIAIIRDLDGEKKLVIRKTCETSQHKSSIIYSKLLKTKNPCFIAFNNTETKVAVLDQDGTVAIYPEQNVAQTNKPITMKEYLHKKLVCKNLRASLFQQTGSK